MVSAWHLGRNIYQLFKLAEPAGISLKIAYHRKVYLLTIEPTLEPYVKKKYKKYKHTKGEIKLTTEPCANCGNIVIGGICINKKCETNASDNKVLKA